MLNGNPIIRVLIADSDKESLHNTTELFNSYDGFEVLQATNGLELLKIAREKKPQLFILEVAMPKKDGIEACLELRQNASFKNNMIVFYTTRSEDYSQIAAFNAGADDYVIKPVKPNVLKSRVTALMKRYKHKDELLRLKKNKGIYIDREKYLVICDGEELILPRKEFELLALLSSSPRKVFTREEISKAVWGYAATAHNRTIDVHVRKLRQKLGKHYIKTVKGVGYSILLV